MPVTNKLLRSLMAAFLVCGGLYLAKPFLVPLVFGFMLAMLLIPLCRWLERKGAGRALSSVAGVAAMIAAAAGIICLLSWQVAGIAGDADQIADRINEIPALVQQYVEQKLGITVAQQKTLIKEQSSGMTTKAGNKIMGAAGSAVTVLGETLLVTIYTFLFAFYRRHLADFVLKIVAVRDRGLTRQVMKQISSVAQKYISGLGMMIGLLWILYGAGFSIIGVRHALFFAVLCGLLEIVPYVGNLTGSLITAVMAFTQGGSNMALWVLAVYAVVQFTQTYLLEPLVVGARVSINPFCTIVVIIAGEMLWGIPGMVLGIPLLGIVKIVCDNVPGLQPFGFLIGEVKVAGRKKGSVDA